MAGTERALLWASDDPSASRETVEGAAREFGMVVRFCAPHEMFDAVRGGRCDLIGLELPFEPRQTLSLLKELHQRLPRITVFALSSDAGVSVIRAALEAGASDFLSLPVNRQELHKAFIKFMQLSAMQEAGRAAAGDVVAVAGARGGLGATTVAVNLAVQLVALSGSQTALVDLDLQRGDVSAFLNLTPMQSIAAIAAARSDVDEIFLHSTLTRHASGVFVLPAPPQIDEADIISHEDVAVTLRLLRSQFRYTVIDMPRTITGAALAGYEQADRILVLTDLSVPGVRAARRLCELLGRIATPGPRVDLVVTQAVPGPVELKDAVRTIGKEPLLVIPRDDAAAGKAMNSGMPLNGSKPAGLSLAVGELAAKVSGVRAAAKGKGGYLRRIFTRETRP